jgi:hypothetical protein
VLLLLAQLWRYCAFLNWLNYVLVIFCFFSFQVNPNARYDHERYGNTDDKPENHRMTKDVGRRVASSTRGGMQVYSEVKMKRVLK